MASTKFNIKEKKEDEKKWNDKYKNIDINNLPLKYKLYLKKHYLIFYNNKNLTTEQTKKLLELILLPLNKKSNWYLKHYTYNDNKSEILTYKELEKEKNSLNTYCANCDEPISIHINDIHILKNWICKNCQKKYNHTNYIKKDKQLFNKILKNNMECISSKLKEMQDVFHTMNKTKKIKLFKLI